MITRRIATGAATVALLGAGTAVVPAAAHAQSSSDRGDTTVALGTKALSALKKQGVTVAAVKPAKLSGGKLRLPVARGALGARTSWLEHDGGLTFRRRVGGKTIKVSFTELRATLGSTSAISATSAGVRVSLFTVAKKAATVNTGASTATLGATKVTLTAKAATLLRKRLKLKKSPSRALGTVAVDAALRGRTAANTGTGSGTTGGGTTGSGTGTTTPPPATAGCGSVSNQPISRPEPAQLGAPGSPVATSSVQWHVRESFIRYLAAGQGPGDGTVATDGATELPATKGDAGTSALLGYDFTYAPLSGTAVPLGQAALKFSGKLNFNYPSHCIDFDALSPEIDLNPGGTSTAIFTMVGRGGTPIAPRRYALLSLANVSPTTAPDGTITYAKMQATLAPGADNEVFGGLYSPGEAFGWVTVSYKP